MTGRRRRPLRRVGDLLPEVAAQLGLEEELRIARAAAIWQRLVEEQVPGASGGTWLVAVRPPRVIVSADDPGIAAELRLRADALLASFSSAVGIRRLDELRTVIGWRPPGVPGGPR